MKSSISTIGLILLSAICCFATPKRNMEGFVLPYSYPLLNGGGDPIQWIVPVFSGSYDVGGFNGPKRNPCDGADNCYWFDGNGNWRFNFTSFGCPNTCSYVGTGKLTRQWVKLPGNAFTLHLGAKLIGTYTDNVGVPHDDVAAYYNCDLVATAKQEELIGNTLASGNLDIVLSIN